MVEGRMVFAYGNVSIQTKIPNYTKRFQSHCNLIVAVAMGVAIVIVGINPPDTITTHMPNPEPAIASPFSIVKKMPSYVDERKPFVVVFCCWCFFVFFLRFVF